MRQAILPANSVQADQPAGDKRSFECDQCVAPSVAVVTFGEGQSALSLEFCRHHLAEHADRLAAGGHQVRFHN